MLDRRFVSSQIDADVHDARHAVKGPRHVSYAGAARHSGYGERRCPDLWLVALKLSHIQVTHPSLVHYSACRVDPRASCSSAGFSAPHRQNPAANAASIYKEVRIHRGLWLIGSTNAGPCLALWWVSKDVFRAAVLSIMLTLVAGPNASLLCALWCHPEAAPAGPCEHPDQTSTPSITANGSCPDIPTSSTALVREDLRRGVSAPAAQQAVLVARFQFAPPPSPSASAGESGQRTALEVRPLVLALRI